MVKWAMTVSQAEGGSLKQNIFSILILKWHISFCSMPGLNIYIYRYINTHTHGWRKTYFIDHHHPWACKMFTNTLFCKISVHNINWVANRIRTERRKISFTFQSFWCFLVQRLHSVLQVGTPTPDPMIYTAIQLCYQRAINTNCPLNIYKLSN